MTDTLESRIKTMLDTGELSFEGARRRYTLPGHSVGRLHLAGIQWARENGEPRNAAVTKACAVYWKLYEERRG